MASIIKRPPTLELSSGAPILEIIRYHFVPYSDSKYNRNQAEKFLPNFISSRDGPVITETRQGRNTQEDDPTTK